jgi:hypothetical protein
MLREGPLPFAERLRVPLCSRKIGRDRRHGGNVSALHRPQARGVAAPRACRLRREKDRIQSAGGAGPPRDPRARLRTPQGGCAPPAPRRGECYAREARQEDAKIAAEEAAEAERMAETYARVIRRSSIYPLCSSSVVLFWFVLTPGAESARLCVVLRQEKKQRDAEEKERRRRQRMAGTCLLPAPPPHRFIR